MKRAGGFASLGVGKGASTLHKRPYRALCRTLGPGLVAIDGLEISL